MSTPSLPLFCLSRGDIASHRGSVVGNDGLGEIRAFRGVLCPFTDRKTGTKSAKRTGARRRFAAARRKTDEETLTKVLAAAPPLRKCCQVAEYYSLAQGYCALARDPREHCECMYRYIYISAVPPRCLHLCCIGVCKATLKPAIRSGRLREYCQFLPFNPANQILPFNYIPSISFVFEKSPKTFLSFWSNTNIEIFNMKCTHILTF